MKRSFLTLFIVLLAVLVACGGDEEGWSDAERTDFIAGCQDSGAPADACSCMADELEKRFPDVDSPDDFDQEVVAEVTQECISG